MSDRCFLSITILGLNARFSVKSLHLTLKFCIFPFIEFWVQMYDVFFIVALSAGMERCSFCSIICFFARLFVSLQTKRTSYEQTTATDGPFADAAHISS